MSDNVKYTGWATKRGQVKKNWKKRYFVLTNDNNLSYYAAQDFVRLSPKGTISLASKGIKIDSGIDCDKAINWPKDAMKSARLQIEVPGRVLYLYCDSPQEQNLWVSELRRAAGLVDDAAPAQQSRPKARKPNANEELQIALRTKLQALTELPGNDHCFECHIMNPRWTSWNIGVFLCLGCAGSHKCLGPQVSNIKNINLDTWSRTQVERIEAVGNKRAEEYYEALLPEDFSRPECQDIEAMEAFLREKYIDKKWCPSNRESVLHTVSSVSFSETREDNKDASYESAMKDDMASHNWL